VVREDEAQCCLRTLAAHEQTCATRPHVVWRDVRRCAAPTEFDALGPSAIWHTGVVLHGGHGLEVCFGNGIEIVPADDPKTRRRFDSVADGGDRGIHVPRGLLVGSTRRTPCSSPAAATTARCPGSSLAASSSPPTRATSKQRNRLEASSSLFGRMGRFIFQFASVFCIPEVALAGLGRSGPGVPEVDPAVFLAAHSNGLVYDGRLMVPRTAAAARNG
jgi:hypothetical protein